MVEVRWVMLAEGCVVALWRLVFLLFFCCEVVGWMILGIAWLWLKWRLRTSTVGLGSILEEGRLIWLGLLVFLGGRVEQKRMFYEGSLFRRDQFSTSFYCYLFFFLKLRGREGKEKVENKKIGSCGW